MISDEVKTCHHSADLAIKTMAIFRDCGLVKRENENSVEAGLYKFWNKLEKLPPKADLYEAFESLAKKCSIEKNKVE